ncbi:MAG: hypothetical protein AAFX06_28095 [Planctomycetota bacterium]
MNLSTAWKKVGDETKRQPTDTEIRHRRHIAMVTGMSEETRQRRRQELKDAIRIADESETRLPDLEAAKQNAAADIDRLEIEYARSPTEENRKALADAIDLNRWCRRRIDEAKQAVGRRGFSYQQLGALASVELHDEHKRLTESIDCIRNLISGGFTDEELPEKLERLIEERDRIDTARNHQRQ